MVSVSGVGVHFRPVFAIQDGTQVKRFVEQTYDKYVDLEQTRKLNVVFDYLVQAEAPGQLTEVKSLLAFVALESLKHTYAYSQGIPYINGYFRKPPHKGSGKGQPWQFKELVQQMLKRVVMAHDLTAAYSLRNDLIHSGLSSESFSRQRELYEDVHDLIREYLLRLLGYRGHYSPYAFDRRGMTAEIK